MIMYDYVKPKYGEKAKLCYMDTGCFTIHVKKYDTYKDIPEDWLYVEEYKNGLDVAQLENIINHLEQNKIDVNIHKEFIKKY